MLIHISESGFLLGREQYVAVNGAKSPVLPVVSGVPQGSVLGPVLFLIYINDVTCVVSIGKMVVYTDDIALYQIIQSPEDYLLVQHDINAVSEWITANYLALNYRKCCHLLFSRKISPTLPVAPLEVNGNFVNQVNEYKYLEVILTSGMSWSSHISAISSKTRKLYRKFYLYSEPHTFLHLYQSLIPPHLEYTCSVWDPHLRKGIERLEGVQKFGLKVCPKRWQCG